MEMTAIQPDRTTEFHHRLKISARIRHLVVLLFSTSEHTDVPPWLDVRKGIKTKTLIPIFPILSCEPLIRTATGFLLTEERHRLKRLKDADGANELAPLQRETQGIPWQKKCIPRKA